MPLFLCKAPSFPEKNPGPLPEKAGKVAQTFWKNQNPRLREPGKNGSRPPKIPDARLYK
jgi:hypothetical protein